MEMGFEYHIDECRIQYWKDKAEAAKYEHKYWKQKHENLLRGVD